MDSVDFAYLQNNRHIAERLLVFLEDRRLLRERDILEDYVYCRKSADALRQVLGNEMLLVHDGGVLLDVLRDLRRACTNFVSAAGPKSQSFKDDDSLFRYHLEMLREVFGQRVRLVVEIFGLSPSPEIKQIIGFS